VSDPSYVQTRFDAADGLRRLGHALVAHRPEASLLNRLIAVVDDILPQVEAAPDRPDPLAFLSEPAVRDAIASGNLPFLTARAGETAMFEDSVVSGPANPLGIGATYNHQGDGVVARVTLGPAFEGAPGRAHGGIVAALFDETMGAVLPAAGTLAYTGSLEVNYRAATPIGEPLEFRARMTGRQGRRITIEATGVVAGATFAEATGVFISVAEFTDADQLTVEENPLRTTSPSVSGNEDTHPQRTADSSPE